MCEVLCPWGRCWISASLQDSFIPGIQWLAGAVLVDLWPLALWVWLLIFLARLLHFSVMAHFFSPLDLCVSVQSVQFREKHLKNEVCLSLLWVSNTELCIETKLNLSCNCEILLGTSVIPPQAFWFVFFSCVFFFSIVLNSHRISVCYWGLVLCNCCFPKQINSSVTQSIFQGSIEFPYAVPWNIISKGFAYLIKAF